MVQLVLKRVSSRIPADPVAFWLSRLDPASRAANFSHFKRWMTWLNKQDGWKTVSFWIRT
ncbi:MAG: hypothetical protein ABSA92_14865 [Candidatus Bathyarchaeia archaeon]